jgi:hypothetical protein
LYYFKALFQHLSAELEGYHMKNVVRIASLRAENRIRDLPNIKQVLQCFITSAVDAVM